MRVVVLHVDNRDAFFPGQLVTDLCRQVVRVFVDDDTVGSMFVQLFVEAEVVRIVLHTRHVFHVSDVLGEYRLVSA